jgi:hypothetical protein
MVSGSFGSFWSLEMRQKSRIEPDHASRRLVNLLLFADSKRAAGLTYQLAATPSSVLNIP